MRHSFLYPLRLMEEPETKQVVVKAIPIDLWRKLKLRAVEEDATLQATLAKAIQRYLESA